jgi:hypothetical protein
MKQNVLEISFVSVIKVQFYYYQNRYDNDKSGTLGIKWILMKFCIK